MLYGMMYSILCSVLYGILYGILYGMLYSILYGILYSILYGTTKIYRSVPIQISICGNLQIRIWLGIAGGTAWESRVGLPSGCNINLSRENF